MDYLQRRVEKILLTVLYGKCSVLFFFLIMNFTNFLKETLINSVTYLLETLEQGVKYVQS